MDTASNHMRFQCTRRPDALGPKQGPRRLKLPVAGRLTSDGVFPIQPGYQVVECLWHGGSLGSNLGGQRLGERRIVMPYKARVYLFTESIGEVFQDECTTEIHVCGAECRNAAGGCLTAIQPVWDAVMNVLHERIEACRPVVFGGVKHAVVLCQSLTNPCRHWPTGPPDGVLRGVAELVHEIVGMIFIRRSP